MPYYIRTRSTGTTHIYTYYGTQLNGSCPDIIWAALVMSDQCWASVADQPESFNEIKAQYKTIIAIFSSEH